MTMFTNNDESLTTALQYARGFRWPVPSEVDDLEKMQAAVAATLSGPVDSLPKVPDTAAKITAALAKVGTERVAAREARTVAEQWQRDLAARKATAIQGALPSWINSLADLFDADVTKLREAATVVPLDADPARLGGDQLQAWAAGRDLVTNAEGLIQIRQILGVPLGERHDHEPNGSRVAASRFGVAPFYYVVLQLPPTTAAGNAWLAEWQRRRQVLDDLFAAENLTKWQTLLTTDWAALSMPRSGEHRARVVALESWMTAASAQHTGTAAFNQAMTRADNTYQLATTHR